MRSGIRIGTDRQGPTGSGQGGWTACRFEAEVGQPLEISIRAPIPLDTDLVVEDDPGGAGWSLVDRTSDATIMSARPRAPLALTTPAVSVGEARRAHDRFRLPAARHPVPHCFSCGLGPDSMGVQAGPLDDGRRYATDWTPPAWSVSGEGLVDHGALWAALDCTAAWFVCGSDQVRVAVTVRYAVDVVRPIVPARRYALVAWPGDGESAWVGRKRSAASAAFDEDGACVATAESLWVSVEG